MLSNLAFSGLYQNGYLDLVPVIPPGATLTKDSKIDEAQLGKIVGRMNKRNEWSGFNFLTHVTDDTDCLNWDNSPAGIGIVCRAVIALDIDVTSDALSAKLHRLAIKHLGDAPVRTGRAPKRLLMYRLTPDEAASGGWPGMKLWFNADDGQQHLIEVLGNKQFFVMAGVHPKTGKPYQWDRPVPAMVELPTVSREQVEAYLAEATALLELLDCTDVRSTAYSADDRAAIDQTTLSAGTSTADLRQMAEVVAAIPNDARFEHRDDYVKFGCAIKAAFAADEGLGLQVFQDWCARWKDQYGRENDPQTVEWDWSKMHPPFGVGANWLRELARDAGYNDAGMDFEPVATRRQVNDLLGEDAEGADDDTDSEDEGCSFWDGYVYVESMERFVDLNSRRLLSRSQFAYRHANVGKGPASNENAAVMYLTNMGKRRVVDRVTYRPGSGVLIREDEDSAVNTWKKGPWTTGVHVADTSVRPYLALLEHVFPNAAEREHLLDWMAGLIQMPGVKFNWHPVLGSPEHGLGKDTLLLPLSRGLGKRNVKTIKAAELTGQWTHWLHEAQMVIVEEMNTFSRLETMDAIKPLLSAPPEEVMINIKGTPQFTVPNITNAVFFTNHHDALALEEKDRRFFVLWSEAIKWEPAQYAQLHDWLNTGGDRLVFQWLACRDLKARGFNPFGAAPMTDAKLDMIESARSPVGSWLHRGIEEQFGPFARDLVTVEELLEFMRQDEPPTALGLTVKKLGMAMRKTAAVKIGKARLPGQYRPNVWALRRGEVYRRECGDAGRLADLYQQQKRKAARDSLLQEFEPEGDD